MKLYNDHFQNYKQYNIPKAQLIIADIPYNLGNNAYASGTRVGTKGAIIRMESRSWQGLNFLIPIKISVSPNSCTFCTKMLRPEPKETGKAPCMIVFCAFDQQFELIEKAKKYGLNKYINLVFRKNFSAQVLKANMRVVGNCEYAVLLYRDKLPKFNNKGKMIMNCMDWVRDTDTEKVHPTQKPVKLLERLIEIFTDEGEVVIDPCAGSGTTLIAANNKNRKAFGFEIKKNFFKDATRLIHENGSKNAEIEKLGYAKTEISKINPILFQ